MKSISEKKIKTPLENKKLSGEPSDTNGSESLKDSFFRHLRFSQAKDGYSATKQDYYKSLAASVNDKLIDKWLKSQQTYYDEDAKRVYYLSIEFLIGRSLGNALINLNMYDDAKLAMHELGHDLEELLSMETEADLGNGGLGRLAACFLDSMATLALPAYGYGIRYEYGMFVQKILDGYQVESSDNWSRYGNPWGIVRPEHLYPVSFYGNVEVYEDDGVEKKRWVNAENVMALACDIPVPGYGNNTVLNMRLWSARSSYELDFDCFQTGDYAKAVTDKVQSETISKVLYPSDDASAGKELRFKQEYFFVSATIQDIIRRYKKGNAEKLKFENFADKVAIQLNDTHPAIAIAELMRVLVDVEGLHWGEAWDITIKTFGYTNHTILPEALEKWPVELIGRILPRHLEIIYKINYHFLEDVRFRYPDDCDGKIKRMSLIDEDGEKRVKMANLAIVGSHSINGVSKIHTEILKSDVFKDFYELWPDRFNNKTNGITQRRWLKLCNPELSKFISDQIGNEWVKDLYKLKSLASFVDNEDFIKKWRDIKSKNKSCLAGYIRKTVNIDIDVESIFDCHIKRIHEYKRQLLKVLHIVNMYNHIKADPGGDVVPRTFIFSGKAAPSYFIAKLIIKLINSIAEVINNDPDAGDKMKIVFLPNYSVSLAEMIIPAIDLSEQISTAGTEASGTGNMKATLNGALIAGTYDGANIEIIEAVGRNNIFRFGLKADEIVDLQKVGYDPVEYYQNNSELKQVLDMINEGYFSKDNPELFRPIVDSLLYGGDRYMVLADFDSYMECQKEVDLVYKEQEKWTKMSILNTANMGVFSSDDTIRRYAEEIWDVKPVD